MDYAEELALKRRRVQDNLARIGGSEVEVEEILGAAETRATGTRRVPRLAGSEEVGSTAPARTKSRHADGPV